MSCCFIPRYTEVVSLFNACIVPNILFVSIWGVPSCWITFDCSASMTSLSYYHTTLALKRVDSIWQIFPSDTHSSMLQILLNYLLLGQYPLGAKDSAADIRTLHPKHSQSGRQTVNTNRCEVNWTGREGVWIDRKVLHGSDICIWHLSDISPNFSSIWKLWVQELHNWLNLHSVPSAFGCPWWEPSFCFPIPGFPESFQIQFLAMPFVPPHHLLFSGALL